MSLALASGVEGGASPTVTLGRYGVQEEEPAVELRQRCSQTRGGEDLRVAHFGRASNADRSAAPPTPFLRAPDPRETGAPPAKFRTKALNPAILLAGTCHCRSYQVLSMCGQPVMAGWLGVGSDDTG